MAHYRDRAVVLRTYPLGEADRIVVLATRDHGKVRAVAKGVRRTKSRIGGRLEPLGHVSLLLWRGRNLDTVSQVEVIDGFAGVRADLDKLAAAASMAEVADRIFQEEAPNPDLYLMLVRAIGTVETSDSSMVVPAFFLKALASEGVGLVYASCAVCGASPPLLAFDPGQGGALCKACRRGTAVSASAIDVMDKMTSGRLAEVLAHAPSPSVAGEVRHLATDAVEHHLEVRLRSVRLLERA